MAIKILRALAAPLGIACGIGIYKLAMIADGAEVAVFLGVVAGVGSIVGLFFIEHW